MTLMTPPLARSPYSTVPLPGMTSMRSMLASGISDQSIEPESTGFSRCPFSSTSVLLVAVPPLPAPRRLAVASIPSAP